MDKIPEMRELEDVIRGFPKEKAAWVRWSDHRGVVGVLGVDEGYFLGTCTYFLEGWSVDSICFSRSHSVAAQGRLFGFFD